MKVSENFLHSRIEDPNNFITIAIITLATTIVALAIMIGLCLYCNDERTDEERKQNRRREIVDDCTDCCMDCIWNPKNVLLTIVVGMMIVSNFKLLENVFLN